MRGHIYSSVAVAILVAISGSASADVSRNTSFVGAGFHLVGMTEVNNMQSSGGNTVNNSWSSNTSGMDGSFDGATGNIGANSAAGDDNVQSNSAALAAYDAQNDDARIFGGSSGSSGSSYAAIVSNQHAGGNQVHNWGQDNTASVDGAFAGASGNIGANAASGTGNLQANNLSAVASTGKMAVATVDNMQSTGGNYTANTSIVEQTPTGETVDVTHAYTKTTDTSNSTTANGFFTAEASISGEATFNSHIDRSTSSHTLNTAEGSVGAFAEAMASNSFAINGAPVITITRTRDFMAEAQAQAALETSSETSSSADNNASVSGSATAGVGANFGAGFEEVSSTSLSHVETTTYPVFTNTVARESSNTANIGGGAFSGASGNIGVNVAAGTSNLQANHLSLASGQGSVAGQL